MTTEKILIDGVLNPIDKPMVKFYEAALEVSKKMAPSVSFVETGTRSGHASILLLKAIRDSGCVRWLFTIDPYGDKPYGHGNHVSTTFDYGEQHYRNALYSLSKYAWDNDLLHHHYRMRSQEFEFMNKNVEFWYGQGKLEPSYGFVYLDGEHTFEAIKKELDYFLPLLVKGGMIVIDDISLIGDKINELPLVGYEIEYNKLWYKYI